MFLFIINPLTKQHNIHSTLLFLYSVTTCLLSMFLFCAVSFCDHLVLVAMIIGCKRWGWEWEIAYFVIIIAISNSGKLVFKNHFFIVSFFSSSVWVVITFFVVVVKKNSSLKKEVIKIIYKLVSWLFIIYDTCQKKQARKERRGFQPPSNTFKRKK